jgi:hypothetical protein
MGLWVFIRLGWVVVCFPGGVRSEPQQSLEDVGLREAPSLR